MSTPREFDGDAYQKRIADVLARLDANRVSMSVLGGRTGVVPVSQWDEYDRLWQERNAIKGDLYSIIDEIVPHGDA